MIQTDLTYTKHISGISIINPYTNQFLRHRKYHTYTLIHSKPFVKLLKQNCIILQQSCYYYPMVGVMAGRDELFMIAQQSLLLPDHTYAHNSGGDPLAIPSLTWEFLRKFHSTYYHPSNAVFYTYGDIPVREHLERISAEISRFRRSDAKIEIPLQPR